MRKKCIPGFVPKSGENGPIGRFISIEGITILKLMLNK
jgi:hypothetical protein